LFDSSDLSRRCGLESDGCRHVDSLYPGEIRREDQATDARIESVDASSPVTINRAGHGRGKLCWLPHEKHATSSARRLARSVWRDVDMGEIQGLLECEGERTENSLSIPGLSALEFNLKITWAALVDSPASPSVHSDFQPHPIQFSIRTLLPPALPPPCLYAGYLHGRA